MRSIVLVPLLALACTVQTSGTVGGDRPTLTSAVHAVWPSGDATNPWDVAILVTDVPDPCETWRSFREQREADDEVDRAAEIWPELFPEDFWSLGIVAYASTEPPSDLDFTGREDREVGQGPDEFAAALDHVTDWIDPDTEELPRDAWWWKGGTLELTWPDDDTRRLRGRLETTFTEVISEEEAGDLVVSFTSEACPGELFDWWPGMGL